MLPAGNGQGPRHHLLQQCSIALLFQPALTSPFIEFQYTAFSPSAALWDIFLQLLLSFIGFSLSLYSYEVYSSRFRLSTLFHLEFSSKITISWLPLSVAKYISASLFRTPLKTVFYFFRRLDSCLARKNLSSRPFGKSGSFISRISANYFSNNCFSNSLIRCFASSNSLSFCFSASFFS